jgi:hypothetical protein
MVTLPERIFRIMSLEFVISSIVIAFIINVIAGVFLRKTIETPSVFKNRRLEQLKQQIQLTSALYGNPQKLMCFAFRGIGLSIALFILASGIVTVPLATMGTLFSLHLTNNQPPQVPILNEDDSYPPTNKNGVYIDHELTDQGKQKFDTYNKETAAYYEENRQIAKRTNQWGLVFILIGSVIGVAAFFYARGVYKTLYLVANFEAMRKQAEVLTSNHAE